LFAAILIVRRRELFAWEWALLFGVTGLALIATRALIDWLVITAALAVPQLGPMLRDLVSRRRRIGRSILIVDRAIKKVFHAPLLRPQWQWPALWLLGLALVSLLPINSLLPGRDGANWPTGAGDFIARGAMPEPGPWNIFCTFNDGSYLLWRFPGMARVHSDTRGFYYPGEYLMDSFHLCEASPGWPSRLQRVIAQGARYALLRADHRLWLLLAPHIPEPLFKDDTHVIVTIEQLRAAACKFEP